MFWLCASFATFEGLFIIHFYYPFNSSVLDAAPLNAPASRKDVPASIIF
jgi:hypothetical protein